MCPIAQPNGHDGPWLSLQLVPGIAAVIEQCVVAVEYTAGEPVFAHELPDVLLRVQLRTLSGTASLSERCQPTRSSNNTAWRPGPTSAEIAARCRFIITALHQGRIKPTALPSLGQSSGRNPRSIHPEKANTTGACKKDARCKPLPWLIMAPAMQSATKFHLFRRPRTASPSCYPEGPVSPFRDVVQRISQCESRPI